MDSNYRTWVVVAGCDLPPCWWSPPVRAPACFPTGSTYIIMALPLVPWIPDLKGPWPLVKNLNQPLQLPAAMAEAGPGPSLPNKEEAWGLKRRSQREMVESIP